MTTLGDTDLARSLFNKCVVEIAPGELRWDPYLLLRDVHLLLDCAAACEAMLDETVSYVCALGKSGLGLATAVSSLAGRRLIWMQNANSNMLVPTGVDISGETIAIVDEHACECANLCQYCLPLEGCHEATIGEIITLVDADMIVEDGQRREREEYIVKRLDRYGGIRSVFRLSEFQSGECASGETFTIPEYALKHRAWRFEKTPIKVQVIEYDTSKITKESIQADSKVDLLAIPTSEYLLSILKVTPYWVDPWRLLFRQDVVNDIAKGISMIAGTGFDTIVAVSFWALPLSVLLAMEFQKLGHEVNSIICLDEEHPTGMSDPVRIRGRSCLFVDDSLKSGNHLVRSLELAKSFNIDVAVYLAILHNLAWLNKRPLQSVLDSTSVRVLAACQGGYV